MSKVDEFGGLGFRTQTLTWLVVSFRHLYIRCHKIRFEWFRFSGFRGSSGLVMI
jgi:hypothetical protein